MKTFAISLFTFLFFAAAQAQQKPDILEYIKQYKHIAIEEMVRTKIPASITMAQGILESGFGKSPLATNANNHFGIKCHKEWTGEKYIQDDDEANECFRVYEHPEASYVDHSDFLLTRYRYATLFQLPPTDYKAWAHGLKQVGYATNPKYASILTQYIETYNLHEFDLLALAQIEEREKLLMRVYSSEQIIVAKEIEKERTVERNYDIYQVQQSDTLYSIARKFNTTVDELKRLNNLETADLKIGQMLVVAQ